MASSKTTILALPNEILDKIFSYLAWTPDISLIPSCPDITNISLSCRILREAVSPTLFRNVRLKLRWIDGAIAEPGLYRLHKEAAEISKLIRCVHVETEFGQSAAWQLKPFTIPLALEEWNAISSTDDIGSEVEIGHRKRIRETAAELYGSAGPTGSPTQQPSATDHIAYAFFGIGTENVSVTDLDHDSSIAPERASLGEHAAHYPSREDATSRSGDSTLKAKRNDARRRRLQLDALITCMVSLPPQMHSLIFEAIPVDHHDQLQYAFALQFCAMAMKIFANRLQSVTMITRSPEIRRRTAQGLDASSSSDDCNTILAPVLPDLDSVTQLTLASATTLSERLSRSTLDAMRTSLWQTEPLCLNVTHLSLRNVTDKRKGVFDLIKGFSSLTDLTLDGIKMGPDLGMGLPTQRPGVDNPLWLLFLISIRLHRPALQLHLGSLCQWQAPVELPASAVKWLHQEAVPVGAIVDFERETRLTEDFGSFMTLWLADDSDQGRLARHDEGIGKLVDDAFSSRWRTFANLR